MAEVEAENEEEEEEDASSSSLTLTPFSPPEPQTARTSLVLAEEIKVAEIHEFSADDVIGDGDSDEEWPLTYYACEFAHFSAVDIVDMSNNVEVGETVACQPDYDVVAVVANVQEEDDLRREKDAVDAIRVLHSPSATTFVTSSGVEEAQKRRPPLHSTSISSDEFGSKVKWRQQLDEEEEEDDEDEDDLEEDSDQLLNVDWVLLDSNSPKVKAGGGKKANTFPRRKMDDVGKGSQAFSGFLTSNDDLDSDGTAGSSSCDGAAVNINLIHYEDEFCLDEAPPGTIQEAIRRQQSSFSSAPSSPPPPAQTATLTSTTTTPTLTMSLSSPPTSTQTTATRRTELTRLPRGRHPLRGPFGQMLDKQMKTASDSTRRETQSPDSEESDVGQQQQRQQQRHHMRTRSTPVDMGVTVLRRWSEDNDQQIQEESNLKSASFKRRRDIRSNVVKELLALEKSYVESLQFLMNVSK